MSPRLVLVPCLAIALLFGLACLVLELDPSSASQDKGLAVAGTSASTPRSASAMVGSTPRTTTAVSDEPPRREIPSASETSRSVDAADHEDLGPLCDQDRVYLAGLLNAELEALERRLDVEVPQHADGYLAQAERLVEAARLRGMAQGLEAGRYTLVPAGKGLPLARGSRGAMASILVQPARRGLEVVDAIFVLEHDEHAELRDAIEYRDRLAHERLLAAHEEFNRLPIEERERLAGLAKRPTELASASREDRSLIRRCFADGARLGRNSVLHVDW
jgi:hypothetical protein